MWTVILEQRLSFYCNLALYRCARPMMMNVRQRSKMTSRTKFSSTKGNSKIVFFGLDMFILCF
jgi:hypothetical protein